MSICIDDRFQEFSRILMQRYSEQLAQENAEYIIKDILNNRKDPDNAIFDPYYNTFLGGYAAVVNVLVYYFLYLYSNNLSRFKLKWFKEAGIPQFRLSKFGNFTYNKTYELIEDNFEGLDDCIVEIECPYITGVTLGSSNIRRFSLWFNRYVSYLDLSNSDISEAKIVLQSSSVKEVILPKNLKEVPKYFFQDCYELKKVNLPETLTSIEKMGFASCRALTEITLPKSIKYLGEWSFAHCRSLKEIHYLGTKKEWAAIDKNCWLDYNNPDHPDVIDRIICSDGEIKLVNKNKR